MSLVLSLFPGIGLLDMAFEEAGFCVVRGPDLLWGGDIRRFHPPSGRFDGVIGGPPCQIFSRMRHLVPHAGKRHGNMIPEFERCITEAQPRWFLMENVPDAPEPLIGGYHSASTVIDNRWFGEEQQRKRRFSFGATRIIGRLPIDFAVFENPQYSQAVTSSLRKVPVAIGGSGKVKRGLRPDGTRPGPGVGARAELGDMLLLQGLPIDFFGEDSPFTVTAKRKMLGNGVPLAMGRALAAAIKRVVAQGIEAPSGGETALAGSTEGESPVTRSGMRHEASPSAPSQAVEPASAVSPLRASVAIA